MILSVPTDTVKAKGVMGCSLFTAESQRGATLHGTITVGTLSTLGKTLFFPPAPTEEKDVGTQSEAGNSADHVEDAN